MCVPPPTVICAVTAPDHMTAAGDGSDLTQWRPVVDDVEGRFVAASNATLLGTTTAGEQVIYKPVAGERPLWDFPDGSLAIREVLTYVASEWLGLGCVPETVIGDGIYGPGAVQRFVAHDEDFDPLPLVRKRPDELWTIAVLDLVVNNADRKLGHVLRGANGELIAIDHGLTFHHDEKLRTVLWVLAGEAIPGELVQNIATALGSGALVGTVAGELGDMAAEALEARMERIVATGVHPDPPSDRPAIPWPPV